MTYVLIVLLAGAAVGIYSQQSRIEGLQDYVRHLEYDRSRQEHLAYRRGEALREIKALIEAGPTIGTGFIPIRASIEGTFRRAGGKLL
ncbi:membrane protein [Gordonia phage SpeedDemon]|nr:membrane protein [Gordonia phage SpeedDemon]